MNYLAHAYLSFGDPETLMGNMISDFVKGKKKFDFPIGIQRGIALHRAIDTFTDQHAATRQAKEFFRPAYRLYAGAFIDVVYDHFLAIESSEFLPISLPEFSQNTYRLLEAQRLWMPERFSKTFDYMKEYNWLYHYRTTEGIKRSLGGLVRRTKYLTDSGPAEKLFDEHYQRLQELFRQFWIEMKPFALGYFQKLQNEAFLPK